MRRLGKVGDLTEIRVAGRAIRIDEDSVERHIAARRIGHGSTSAAHRDSPWRAEGMMDVVDCVLLCQRQVPRGIG